VRRRGIRFAEVEANLPGAVHVPASPVALPFAIGLASVPSRPHTSLVWFLRCCRMDMSPIVLISIVSETVARENIACLREHGLRARGTARQWDCYDAS
jgi:hypothetical protein